MQKQNAKKESAGTVIAARARARANAFTDGRRQELLERGMAMIYGGSSQAKAS